MQRRFRLRSREEFQKVYQQGRSQANRAAVVYSVFTRSDQPVVGFAAGRKLGSAVIRNRVKRRLREIVRQLWPRVRSGTRLVIIGRAAAVNMTFGELAKRIEELLVRVGAIAASGGERG